jgi:ribosomal protein S12 methylthiotransferase accessory factor
VTLEAYVVPSTSDIADDVRTCVRRAGEAGLEVLVLDYSRPDFPLRTAKVIMPGTCHIFPYRGASRLYEVPVRMGCRGLPLGEAGLNPLELLI